MSALDTISSPELIHTLNKSPNCAAAAAKHGVSVKTLRNWVFQMGNRDLESAYTKCAKKALVSNAAAARSKKAALLGSPRRRVQKRRDHTVDFEGGEDSDHEVEIPRTPRKSSRPSSKIARQLLAACGNPSPRTRSDSADDVEDSDDVTEMSRDDVLRTLLDISSFLMEELRNRLPDAQVSI